MASRLVITYGKCRRTLLTVSTPDDWPAPRHQIDRLEAQFIRRLHRFDRGHGAVAEGAASTVSWLRGACGLSGGAAVDCLRMARVLADLPETAASFRAGAASLIRPPSRSAI
jgi:hypothetical protein